MGKSILCRCGHMKFSHTPSARIDDAGIKRFVNLGCKLSYCNCKLFKENG